MGDNHPLCSDLGCDFRQAACDIFVGKTVETVASDAFGVELLWYGVMVRQGAVAAMKGRVETCKLRDFRKARQNRSDRRQIIRLVKRRQRHIALQTRQN